MRVNSNRPIEKYAAQAGYTLLELILTVGIIAIMAKFAMAGMDNWTVQRRFSNTVGDLQRTLMVARQEAEARNSTVRVLTVRSGDNYTITIYANTDTTPPSTCVATGNWTVVSTTTISVAMQFQITGNGIGNTCFFRDGTASSRTYNVVQKDGGTNLRNATIIVTVATGMPDITITGGV